MAQKSIVITGCSSGFGRYTAFVLAEQGWHVFATVRKESDRVALLQEAEQRHCQSNISLFICDITQSEQVARLARDVEDVLRSVSPEAVPCLDALLNNAGTAYGGPIELLSLDDLRAQFEINVIAHVGVIQTLLPLLKAARGTIISVSSISGKMSIPVTGLYSASKYALEALSDALRLELAPFGVKVVLIEPASSPTGIWLTSLERSFGHIGIDEHNPYERLLTMAKKSAQRSSKKGFPIQKFSDTVLRILADPKPRARYGVPFSASALMFLRLMLPDRLWDKLIRLVMHW
ncbi:SDR family NAD(P)-dependent oxidoreductase [Dictyobacter arantiisoli]|uniref:Short-chain dehydrogenase/reductase n=1 Tax=Dictyobacter arantiisoli TaxID=2014874 RepID=A0A5A5TDI2_9CHLR|nr:SDR family NAD(P)-dependent oxidoreductase [Dictyobacter arantiisoli]GCF09338.1 short-chain dehydrogenase/reductase [Dictyobacter arantiisoli]